MSYFISRLDSNIPDVSTNTVGPLSRLHGKSYEQLKQECLEQGRLFNDPDFPANSASLGLPDRMGRYIWKRPKDICDNPRFMADGISRFDVKQGELGDCWLAAGLVALCDNQSLMRQVVPMDQSMAENYAGIFHFFFWQYGKWIEVIIDDKLPTLYGQLAFIASTDNTEFWSALLEKAYAKLHGSYGALEGGHAIEAMEDFTGGVCEWFELKDKAPSDLDVIISKALERCSLLSCAIEAQSSYEMEAELSNGLIQGHAYTVNLIKTVQLITGASVTLLRLRNPWGNDKEWKLAWSDGSSEWSLVSPWERQQMEYARSADGEFWMSFHDFIRSFDKLEVCNLGPDALTDQLAERSGRRWEMVQHEGEWIRNVTAGGCLNYWKTSFFSNPQFRLHVETPDEDDDTGTVLVALMQKKLHSIKYRTSRYTTIGFAIFKLDDADTGPLDKCCMRHKRPKCTSEFINLREVSHRYKLEPGVYCVIPSTFEPNLEREFILRLYSEQKCRSVMMDEFTSVIERIPEAIQESDDAQWDVGSLSSESDGDSNDSTSECEDAADGLGQDSSMISGINRLHHLLISDDDGLTITGGVTEAVSILADSLKRPLETKNEKKRVIAAFGELSDHSMEMDAYKLCDILTEAYNIEFDFNKFSVDVCRSMVAMLDDDRSGKLNFREFKKLWRSLKKWVKIFKDNDIDQKGFVRSFQLREILKTVDVFDESGLAGTIELNLDQFIQTTMYN